MNIWHTEKKKKDYQHYNLKFTKRRNNTDLHKYMSGTKNIIFSNLFLPILQVPCTAFIIKEENKNV